MLQKQLGESQPWKMLPLLCSKTPAELSFALLNAAQKKHYLVFWLILKFVLMSLFHSYAQSYVWTKLGLIANYMSQEKPRLLMKTFSES